MTALALVLAAVDQSQPLLQPAVIRTEQTFLAQEPMVRRLVHRLLGWPGGAGEVDDVVQEVFLAAWRHRHAFRGDASVGTWLVRIAIRKTQHHARWRAVRTRCMSLFGAPDSLPAPAAAPDDDRLQMTSAAMARLQHGDREVLVLCYLDGRSIADTAALLGITRAALDQRLSRARGRLRRLLGEELEP